MKELCEISYRKGSIISEKHCYSDIRNFYVMIVRMTKPFNFEKFKEIYCQVPRLTVEVVIQDTNGTLLTLRKMEPHAEFWHLPGGTVYFKESLADAVKRIAKEELGIDVSVGKFLGYIEYLHQEEGGGFDHPVGLAFLCHPISTDFVLNDQASTLKYFLDFPLNMMEEQKIFLERVLHKEEL